MKKNLLSLLFIFFSLTVLAQTDTVKLIDLPIKDGTIYFENVVQVDSTMKKAELYSKAREWFVNYYKSANDVLQLDDKAEGKLIGKGLHPYSFANGLNIHGIKLFFTVNITVKDSKYRYQIYGFNGEDHDQSMLSSSGDAINKINFDEEYQTLITKGSRKNYRLKMLNGLKKEVLAIVLSLEKATKAKNVDNF